MTLRRGLQSLGDIIDIRGPRGGKLIVEAPDGLELRIPAEGGRAQLGLAQPGTWRVRWSVDGEVSEIDVADDRPHAPAKSETPQAVRARRYGTD